MAKGSLFIERSLAGALSFFKESVFADEYAAKKGFLQSLDPRVKAVTFILFIAAVLFTRHIAHIVFLYGLCLVLAHSSGIRMGFFLKRTWIFIPIFSFFIAVPAIFNIFTPGEAVFTVDLFGAKLIITRQGLLGALLFVVRVTTSVSFAVLLSVTTRHFILLKVLRLFGVPQVFVMTLGMCYRYIYLFMEVIENTCLALKSRVGRRLHYKKGQQIAAWSMSGLWQRSYCLNEALYSAMLSRGYAGEPRIANTFRAKPRDWAWLSFTAVIFIAVLLARRNY